MFTKSMAISLTMVSLFASLAMAEETQTSAMGVPKPGTMNVHDPVGWFPFIGLSGGYMSPDDTLKTEGTPGDLKILGSYFSEGRHSVFDIGLGFMGDSFTQKSATQNNFISGGLAELAWRYNGTNRWQFGVVADSFIGGGTRYGSTDPNSTTFGGLQLMKEIPVKGSNMFRMGLKGLTSLSIPNKSINTVMLDLQWGFGSEQKAPEVGSAAGSERETAFAETARSETSPEALAAAGDTSGINARRVIEADPSGNAVTLRNDARMQFDTGHAVLTGMNAEYVEKLGKVLSERSDLFDKVEVVGFADQTGSQQINMKVSKARSQQVSKRLAQGGLAKNKIQTSWKGSEDPLYKSLLPEDMQQNRRVDLKFHGVKDPAALQELLSNM
jgi:outer membrane protein OmpA-like peptidoglycan-associated protein